MCPWLEAASSPRALGSQQETQELSTLGLWKEMTGGVEVKWHLRRAVTLAESKYSSEGAGQAPGGPRRFAIVL